MQNAQLRRQLSRTGGAGVGSQWYRLDINCTLKLLAILELLNKKPEWIY